MPSNKTALIVVLIAVLGLLFAPQLRATFAHLDAVFTSTLAGR